MSIEHSPTKFTGQGRGRDSSLPDRYLSNDQVCEFLGGKSKQTLHRYRQKEGFPQPVYITPRTPLTKLSELEAWVERQSRAVPHNENLKNAAEE